ncbi:hypothetical protein K523DRAFT_102498 [Schizophyllum commune Tattone D]|nr:hypothetical protein K523DRAFT_102498 [Schizophyllum commune Tattone D]
MLASVYTTCRRIEGQACLWAVSASTGDAYLMREAAFLSAELAAEKRVSRVWQTGNFTFTKLAGHTKLERDLHLLVALPHVELCRPILQLEHLHTYTVCYERTYRRQEGNIDNLETGGGGH